MILITITVIICVTLTLCTTIIMNGIKHNCELECGLHNVPAPTEDLIAIQEALDKEYQDLKVPTFDAIMGAINDIEMEMEV